MKTLFVITGIGLGHTIRQEPIINEVKKKSEVMITGFDISYNYFKNRYNTFRILGHVFYGNNLRTSNLRIILENLIYPLFLFVDTLFLSYLILKYNINTVVVDAEPCGLLAGKLTGRKTVIIYNLDLKKLIKFRKKKQFDFGLLLIELIVKLSYSMADRVVIPTLDKKCKNESNMSYIEPIVRIKPGKLKSRKLLMKKLGFEKEPILVTIGGSNFGIPLIKELIIVAKDFNEQFVIFGGNFRTKGNVKCFKFKKNFLEYLKISKCVIGSFGHSTLSEIFVYNKAALVFPINGLIEHELNLIDLKEYIKTADFSTITKTKLRKMISNLLKDRTRLQEGISKLGFRGEGVSEAVKLILK